MESRTWWDRLLNGPLAESESERVNREREQTALPGGAFGTHWDGGDIHQREAERARLIRRWSEVERG